MKYNDVEYGYFLKDRYFAFNKFDQLLKYHQITPGKITFEQLKFKYGRQLFSQDDKLEELQNYVINTMKLQETYSPEHKQYILNKLQNTNEEECKKMLTKLIYDCDESCLLKLFGLLTKKFKIRTYDSYNYAVKNEQNQLINIVVPFEQSTISVLQFWLDYLQIYTTNIINNKKIELFYYNKQLQKNILVPKGGWQEKYAVNIGKLKSGYQSIVDARSGVKASFSQYYDSVWCDIRERSKETPIGKRKQIVNLAKLDTNTCNLNNYLKNQYDNKTTHNGSMSCENVHSVIQNIWNKNRRKGFVKTYMQLVLFYIYYNNKRFKWITEREQRFKHEFMDMSWKKMKQFQEMVYISKNFQNQFKQYGICFLDKENDKQLKQHARDYFKANSIIPNQSNDRHWNNDKDIDKLQWFMYTSDKQEISITDKQDLCEFFNNSLTFWQIIKRAKKIGISLSTDVYDNETSNES